MQLVPLSPKWQLFLSQKYSLCVYSCAWSLVRCLPSLRPQHSRCSQPDSLCNDSSAAAGKGDFILGIFQSADPSHPSQSAVPGGCSDFQYPLADGLGAVCDLNAAICISPNLGVSPPPACVVHALCFCPHAAGRAGTRQDADFEDFLVSFVLSCWPLCESTRLQGFGEQRWSRPQVCCSYACTKK